MTIFVLLITFIMSNSFQTLQPNSVAPSLHSECDKPSGLGFNFMEQKICKKCQETKPINRFSYKKAANGRFYYDLKCRDCKNAQLVNNRVLKNNVDIPDLEGEYWVPIINYEDHYLISNFFRIKSLYREVPFRDSIMRKVAQLRASDANSDGYLQVILTKDKKSKTFCTHILMALSFGLPNPFNLPELNHIDGDKNNCLLDNLEWSTHGDNMRHAVKKGLRKYTKVTNPKKGLLTNQDILDIYNSKERTGLIAKKYDLTKSSIQRIKSGKTYSKITSGGGELNSAYHKLSKEDALFIKKSTISWKKLAVMFGVSDTLVGLIKSGKSYKWIDQ